MDIIELHKCVEPEKFLDILDDCIESLEALREKIRQEIYYDELC